MCVGAVCLALAAVNQAVKEQQVRQTLRVLSLPEVALHSVTPQCAAEYQQQLSCLMRQKALEGEEGTRVNH